MNFKKGTKLLLATAMAMSLTACGGGVLKQDTGSGSVPASSTAAANAENAAANTDSAQVITMTFALSESSPHYDAGLKFKELVEQYTNGAYTVEVYPNSSLAGGDQLGAMQMVQKGTISRGWLSPLVLSSIVPDMQAVSIPWIWKDTDHIDAALTPGTDVDKAINSILEPYGYISIGYAENGFRQLTNNKTEIKAPTDMKGIKFRVLGSDMLFDVFKALGSDPMDVNFSELFTALQQGAVDGQENPIATAIVPNKYYEVQKYITNWNYVYEPHPLIFNKKLWDGYDDATKEAIQKAAVEACNFQRQESRNRTAEGIETMKSAGCIVTDLTDDQIQAFKDIATPVADKDAAAFDQNLVNAIKAANK
jgi:tripartite ATP-independent transporter DctP family solute receptor